MSNSNSKDGAEVPQSDVAEVTTSSQTIAKHHVVGSPYLSEKGVVKFRYRLQHLTKNGYEEWFEVHTLSDLEKGSFLNSATAKIIGRNDFTGLNDRNGNEIYEGDILIANSSKSVLIHDYSEARKFVSPNIRDERKFIQLRSRFLVYWQNSFSQFSFMSIEKEKCSIDSDVSQRNIEIIGNVFENPELLEGVQ